jgi:methionyl-tRNA formyltransferase
MEMKPIKVVFMGSPAFSVPILQRLIDSFEVVGVVTQPDRPKGRGKKLEASPVKEAALQAGIAILQPSRLRRDEQAKQQLADWDADVFVVAAFGQILPQDVLDIPPKGCINVHTSLLPRWRGASPIQSAILAGDEITGVTIMQMDAGMDTGPILAQQTYPIEPGITAGELEQALAQLGADLLVSVLPEYVAGEITPVPQREEGVTYCSLIKKEDGLLDVELPVDYLINQIRAYQPWPGTFLPEIPMKILRAQGTQAIEAGVSPGTRTIIDGKPALRCEDGWLVFDEVQPAGKKPMSGEDYLRGNRERWLPSAVEG